MGVEANVVRIVRAIYEKGVFRPLDAVEGLPDRTNVQLQIETLPTGPVPRLSDFAGIWDAAEADEIAAIIEAEFKHVAQ